jgi:HAMP domain-containing protein
LLLLLVFLAGIILSGLAFASILNQRAQNEITSQAMILLTTMDSVRNYTNVEVNPLLKPMLENEFLPESVPAYSAREVFENLRKTKAYNEFFYREATQNPTNRRDLAEPEDLVLIEQFRANANTKELRGFRETAAGKMFYIARPIKITKESCLVCHSTPDAAPKSLIERYGPDNGFGWKLNDIVGTQIISVPASEVEGNAWKSFLILMAIISALFALAIGVVNWLLRKFVIKPVQHLSAVATQVSTGDMDVEFKRLNNDEVGELAAAFSRMKLSLSLAMRMLNQNQEGK